MASTGKCPFCGTAVRSDEKNCPDCGAVNPGYVSDTSRTVFHPKTIEELKEYCAERGMPLQKMRFFIGENYQEPKAFGIYRNEDRFIVYKNKASGERSIRYQGPDEAYAVNELFQKLLDECHKRNIWPDGRPLPVSDGNAAGSGSGSTRSFSGSSSGSANSGAGKIVFFILVGIVLFGLIIGQAMTHRKDGYYRSSTNRIYYRYGSNWYTEGYSDWYKTGSFPEEDIDDYYLGQDYRSDWGGTNFKNSSAWDSIVSSNSSDSSDYDSWDAGDTDWDSDW